MRVNKISVIYLLIIIKVSSDYYLVARDILMEHSKNAWFSGS